MASNHKQSLLHRAKSLGFSDWQIATLVGSTEDEVRALRKKIGLVPSYRLVDTCAAEFEAYTPYYYSTYDTGDDEVLKTDTRKVMILGGGPNRIGQGIEFDYCCVHAAFALKELGFETIMVNSNPETVSTDYDTSDKLFFEPLTQEDVLNIYEREQCWGAIAQFGGQTPLNLALGLQKQGVNIIGTTPQSIEMAEDRELFSAMLDKLGIPQPPNGIATNEDEALTAAHKVGYPVLVRPSFVLGGRAMQIVYSDDEIRHYMRFAVEASPERPVLVDKFLEEAFEVDVDCVADIGVGGNTVVVGGMLEHIEFAGCHSGDAAMVLPPHSIWPENIERMRRYTHTMARELKVAGLMNVQFAVKGMNVWVLEVNPRASRTVPFVSKAIGVPLAKLAAKVMTGKKLTELGFTGEIRPKYYSVKESVFPFSKFPGQDILLGPEMRSTGEVMGLGEDWGVAYAKSQMAAAPALPQQGRIFISVRDSDKKNVVPLAQGFRELGFELCATSGTAQVLQENGIEVQILFKIAEGRPNVLDMIKNGEVQLIVNTPAGKTPRVDEVRIRSAAVAQKIPIMTTLAGANAALQGIQAFREHGLSVCPLQEYHASLREA
jgi:carbamoyl-phosphate synthase large subunit